MHQPGQDLGFKPQSLADLVAGDLLQNLDGDSALENLVRGAIDGTHAATPKFLVQMKAIVQRGAEHRGTSRGIQA